MSDRQVVAIQIGREPRSVVDVVARCDLGLPTVIQVPPHLDDGTPFPTMFWLTCPLASRRIGRLEAAGGVKSADERIASDPEFAAAHTIAMERYSRERDRLVGPNPPAHLPEGGVAGSRGGVKCLHAHYADHAVGSVNPVGASVAPQVEPLDCSVRCVVEIGGEWMRNPEWVEPKQ